MSPHSRRGRRTALLSAVASLLVFAAAPAGGVAPLGHATVARGVAAPPNIVLILTDDQRWDTLWAMPTVQAQLVDEGHEVHERLRRQPALLPEPGDAS